MEKQFVHKNWEVSFSLCHQLGTYGNFALPFHVSWWYSNDVLGAFGNRNFEISVYFLCFRFGVDIWKWRKGE